MSRRVVVTGMGVVAPNAIGLQDFDAALRAEVEMHRADGSLVASATVAGMGVENTALEKHGGSGA